MKLYVRKVTMLQLNDSKFIAIAIYNVAIPSVIITPLVLLLDIERPNVTFTLTAACITFGTTITNCLIFLPKVIFLSLHQARLKATDFVTSAHHNSLL